MSPHLSSRRSRRLADQSQETRTFPLLALFPCSSRAPLSAPSARRMSPSLGSSPSPKRPPIPPRVPTQTAHQRPPRLHHPPNAPPCLMTDTTTYLCRMHDAVCLCCCTIVLLLYLSLGRGAAKVLTLGHVLLHSCLITRPFISFIAGE